MADVGCGTGKVGAAIRAASKAKASEASPLRVAELVGCDLSPRILKEAKRKRVYDRLVCADAVAFLRGLAKGPGRPQSQHQRAGVSAVVAADVLNYVGDLEGFVDAAHGALVPGGALVFTVESLEAAVLVYAAALASEGAKATRAGACAAVGAGRRGAQGAEGSAAAAHLAGGPAAGSPLAAAVAQSAVAGPTAAIAIAIATAAAATDHPQPVGHGVLSVERGFALLPMDRFGHAAWYVEGLLTKGGRFDMVRCREEVIRREAGAAVSGRLYVCRKSADPAVARGGLVDRQADTHIIN